MRALLKVVPVAAATATLILTVSPPFAQSGERSGGQAAPAVPLERATPTKIMPIGDSNTAGADATAGGYRTDLWALLNADQRRTQAFNATIPGMVDAKRAAGRQVTYVDTGSAYVAPFDLMDNVHPHYGAASRAASKWYAALTDLPVARYEAEQTANAKITDARVTQITSASGGAKSAYIDFATSSVVFTVQVGAAGNYRVRARGSNGMGRTCSHLIAANGGPTQPVVYPGISWDLFAVIAVDVPLNAGSNALKFTKGDCYTELDAIDLSPTPTA